MEQKIIFLDIDGVLNSNTWNESHLEEMHKGMLIDESKVELLALIVHKTGAKIVMHSGWRFWLDEKLQPNRKEAEILLNMFSKFDIEIADKTPDFSDDEIKKTKRFSLVKAKEIFAWLELHQEVTSWIVLDDLNLHHEEIAKHQIQTNAEVGLTEEDAEEAIRKLEMSNEKHRM